MGRVRRYKKIKSCDLTVKKRGSSAGSQKGSKHDEPPSVFEEKERRAEKRRENGMAPEAIDELNHQREALRVLAANRDRGIAGGAKGKDGKVSTAPEGRRPEETMKAFKIRIRQETRKTLHEELSGRTLTSQKRKEKLKERSLKKKEKKMKQRKDKNGISSDETMEFFSASDGRIRASDRGGPASFPSSESSSTSYVKSSAPSAPSTVSYPVSSSGQGITQSADRPPDMSSFKIKMPAKNPAKSNMVFSGINAPSSKKGSTGSSTLRSLGLVDGIIHSGDNDGRQSGSSAAEMEMLRQRVQAAYQKVKEKRREAKDEAIGNSHKKK